MLFLFDNVDMLSKMANLFIDYHKIDVPQVVDCRICSDPHSALRFAFIEFLDQGELIEFKFFSCKCICHGVIKTIDIFFSWCEGSFEP